MPLIQGTWRGETLRGTANADLIYGHGGNDTLYGGDGDDLLSGGSGIDSLYGGTGNDQYYVDNIADRVFESAGQGTDRVLASVDYILGYGVSVELLTTSLTAGFAPITLVGNNLANRIFGNAGANILVGQGGADSLHGLGGNDVLEGGAGSDVLSGGAGADEFIFGSFGLDPPETGDRITDFTSGVDHLYLRYDLAEDFDWIGSAAFSGVAGQARFAGGLFQIDHNGDGVADFAVAITGTLVESDIWLATPWDYY